MDLNKKYITLKDEELVSIAENKEYTLEARETAYNILSERNIDGQVVQELSREFFKHYFKSQFQKTILTKIGEIEIPKSHYLNKSELKKIAQTEFQTLAERRRDFYRDLPNG